MPNELFTANPASVLLTQREIGAQLAMPRRQVETVLARFDTKVEQMASWIAKRDDALASRRC